MTSRQNRCHEQLARIGAGRHIKPETTSTGYVYHDTDKKITYIIENVWNGLRSSDTRKMWIDFIQWRRKKVNGGYNGFNTVVSSDDYGEYNEIMTDSAVFNVGRVKQISKRFYESKLEGKLTLDQQVECDEIFSMLTEQKSEIEVVPEAAVYAKLVLTLVGFNIDDDFFKGLKNRVEKEENEKPLHRLADLYNARKKYTTLYDPIEWAYRGLTESRSPFVQCWVAYVLLTADLDTISKSEAFETFDRKILLTMCVSTDSNRNNEYEYHMGIHRSLGYIDGTTTKGKGLGQLSLKLHAFAIKSLDNTFQQSETNKRWVMTNALVNQHTQLIKRFKTCASTNVKCLTPEESAESGLKEGHSSLQRQRSRFLKSNKCWMRIDGKTGVDWVFIGDNPVVVCDTFYGFAAQRNCMDI